MCKQTLESFFSSDFAEQFKNKYNAIGSDRVTWYVFVLFAMIYVYLLSGVLWVLWKVIVLVFVAYSTFVVIQSTPFFTQQYLRSTLFLGYCIMLMYLITRIV
eukprot:TRINITY_DN5281_c0_g1_i1.p1 TRINITY_DN5281_c0_g1~~TRINITY_DN5281_c0_g1_i1.p1  ORF type:complete len:102 (+),score=0.57 TRINITY_DN5281_c0_g1_i1:312-617(+)